MVEECPLFFGFTLAPCEGRGFAAGIRVQGRAIARRELEGWWLDGVEPGSLADGGASILEAVESFRTSFTRVMFGFADEARDFGEFKAMAQAFFEHTDVEDEGRWEAARLRPRARNIPHEVQQLETETGSRPSRIEIHRLDSEQLQASPEHNRLDCLAAAA